MNLRNDIPFAAEHVVELPKEFVFALRHDVALGKITVGRFFDFFFVVGLFLGEELARGKVRHDEND